jgi:ADP-ribosyl-[dinitrogen reductase] hydrolase
MLIEESRGSARITHADPKAQSSCVLLNLWIAEMLLNGTRDARRLAVDLLHTTEQRLWQRLKAVENNQEDLILSSGYTVDTLEAAAWSFLTTDSFEEAVVKAANLGGDADTVAAVTGALAGAFYGYSAIPERWRDKLKDAERIRKTAISLAHYERNS